MLFERPFDVVNPSPYPRGDYVEVRLRQLGVPDDIDETRLRLFRLEGTSRTEVDFQIDSVFGTGDPVDRGERTLTFFSMNTPPGDPDYLSTSRSARFHLQEVSVDGTAPSRQRGPLLIEHFYRAAGGSSLPRTGTEWDPSREVDGVKLHNGFLKVYFSLVPHTDTNNSGAATSIFHARAADLMDDGMLKPFGGGASTRWGQLTDLVFYPLPWEPRWYHVKRFVGDQSDSAAYTLVWSRSGPVRAVVTLKSDPLEIEYDGGPYFQGRRTVRCHLYRILSLSPAGRFNHLGEHSDFYTEQLCVRTDDHCSLAFRPQFYSSIEYPPGVPPLLHRLEHIPDYFVVWRHFGAHCRAYGFASNAHVRAPAVTDAELRWHLQVAHNPTCIHSFTVHGYPDNYDQLDKLHVIGHSWYERLFKPLMVVPLDPYLRRPPKDSPR